MRKATCAGISERVLSASAMATVLSGSAHRAVGLAGESEPGVGGAVQSVLGLAHPAEPAAVADREDGVGRQRGREPAHVLAARHRMRVHLRL